MKTIITFIIFLSLFVSTNAQIRWLETERDLGLIDEAKGEVETLFRMVNDGIEPVAIISVKASCGCTKVDYPVEAIAPGDTAFIKAVFNPDKFAGDFNKGITVKTSDKEKRDRLSVLGSVKASESTVNFRYPGDYGAIRMQQSWMHISDVPFSKLKCRTFPAYNNSADTLQIKVLNSPEYLNVKPTPSKIAPYKTFSFICYIDPTKATQKGAVDDSVTIEINTDKILKIPFSAYLNEK